MYARASSSARHRLPVPYTARTPARGYGKCDTPISINVHVLDHEKMKCSRDSSQMDLTAFFKDSTEQQGPSSKQVCAGTPSGSTERSDPSTSKSAESRSRVHSPDRGKHSMGYKSRWEKSHSWVYCVEGERMYCKLCQKFDARNRQNHTAVWNREACTTLRKDVLARHEASAMHKEALEQERDCKIVQA